MDRQYSFGPFRFDFRTGEVRTDCRDAKLTPRAAAVLAMLAERAEDIVSKQELFDRVWGGLAVGDDALTSCIQELRSALGDDARNPRYIETRHRRGYRLMLRVEQIVPASSPPHASPAGTPDPLQLVGRTAEMADLQQCLKVALSGRRQLVLLTGEPGIGKSTLACAFSDGMDRRHLHVAHGQCLDHHGVGEPYLPLIEALTRLASGRSGAAVKTALATHAPSWLAQMPSLWSRTERSAMEARGSPTRERMLRELTQAVEAISATTPLVLILEDIHWSDYSTLDWLVHIARRNEPARLLVLATLRPAGAAALSGITSELALHKQCHEIALMPLPLEAIEAYLAMRLGDEPSTAMAPELASLLLVRTGGNPLFMVSLVDELVHREGSATAACLTGAIPQDVRRFIERQIDDLDELDRELLAAASVVGRHFATAAVAAALDSHIDTVEIACARLARLGVFIGYFEARTWPDNTSTELYRFRHDLYRELLYERLSARRRVQSHARVGSRLDAAWSTLPDAIAAEIAEHLERGRAPVRAIPHLHRAAIKALRRSANQEAIGLLRRALDVIGYIADENERTKTEIELQVVMGAAYMALRGFGAPEVQEAYDRAESLCDRLGERADLFPAIWGQWMFRTGRSETAHARRLGTRLIGLGEKFGKADLKLQAHHAMWSTSFVGGELAAACAHADAGLSLYEPERDQAMASKFGNHDARCCARNFSAMSLALIGEESRSRQHIDEALATVRRLEDPFSLALTLFFTSAAAQMLGDCTRATENSREGLAIATENDLAMPKAWSMGVVGWCMAESGELQDGIEHLRQAIAWMQAMQTRHFMGYLIGLLASALLKAGLHDDARAAVAYGLELATASGELFFVAELHRLHGELCLCSSSNDGVQIAKVSFQKAIAVATQQGARALERKTRKSLQLLA